MSNDTEMKKLDEDLDRYLREQEGSGEYTVAELLAMSDKDFEAAVSEDLRQTSSWRSAFMDPQVIFRTEIALIQTLSRVEEAIHRQAEDPTYSAERYAKSLTFRRMVIMCIEILDRQVIRNGGSASSVRKGLKFWRQVANELADVIEGTALDRHLDEIEVALAGGSRGDGAMTVRQWVAVRRLKDPSRVPAKDAA